MQFTDLHIHSHYSRATSPKMNIEDLANNATLKGIDILGTGDFTHPKWLEELKKKLGNNGSGVYDYDNIKFILSGEISLIYSQGGKGRRVHHCLLAENFAVVDQINEWLSKKGRRDYDGRPIFGFSSIEFAEAMMSISKDIEIIPSHVWTPWFGILGSMSGFNSIEECFQDQSKHIHAIETGLSCYDEETEILTESGWKKFTDVRYSDKICTLNIQTNEIEFQKPIKVHKYHYKGKMYRLKTKRIDLLVTPNHRLLYSPCDFRKPPKFFLKEAELLFQKSKRFKKDGIWYGENSEHFILPKVMIKHGSRYYSGHRIKKEKKIPIKPWLKFFGFWIAEGWTYKGKNGDYNVCLANHNKALLVEMKTLLENFGYTVFKDKKEHVIRVRDYQLFCYLKQFGKCSDKFIPSEIKALSKDLLEIFLNYYIKGDGHIYGRDRKGLSAVTTSIRLRDDLQEIALKIGISAYYKLHNKKGTPFKNPDHKYKKIYKQRKDSWVIYFIRKNLYTVIPSVIKKYNYIETWVGFDDFVFCVSVPNKVIYVRRNGIPVWCGNSDPPMNWRLSSLDKYTLVSNSDSHSPYPWRLGREVNVFDLKEITYNNIINAIRTRKNFLFTVEVSPSYGKYHFDGHRNCNISMSPDESAKNNNTCPRCNKELTIGVLHRVEELADRQEGYKPADAVPYKSLIPLSEIIACITGTDVFTKRVWEIYNQLIAKFGNEFNVLLNAEKEELKKTVNEKLADLIIKNRHGKIKIIPGYDGVYGKPVLESKKEESLKDFLK